MLLTLAALDDESVVTGLLDDACVDELRHQVGGCRSALHLVLELLKAVLQAVDLGELEGRFGQDSFLFFLLGLDLRLGPSSLRAHLEHLGADALAD